MSSAAARRDHQRWWLWRRGERAVAWLSHLPAATVFIGFLLWFGAWTVLAGVLVESVLDGEQADNIATAAGRLMPAFGILFAFLTGFVISNQWNRSRDAEATAGHESDACLRLALASESPGLDGPRIRSQLVAYLEAVLELEWTHQSEVRMPGEWWGTDEARDALLQLEQDVRVDATNAGVHPAVTLDVLDAAQGLAVARRGRLALTGHGVPAPLFLLVFVSGIVLCLNAIAVVVGIHGPVSVALAGLVVLVALDLALIVAISDPFRGPMRVVPARLEAVCADLRSRRFGPIGTVGRSSDAEEAP